MALYGEITITDGMVGRLKSCHTCKKPILIEEKYNGTCHTMMQVVSHWECLTPAQQDAARQHYKLEQ